MPAEPRTPDALYVPHVLSADPSPFVRAEKLTEISRNLLAMPDGTAPVISPYEYQGDRMVHFVRRSAADSKLFPMTHARAGETRHDWAEGPDGIRLGYSKGD